MRFSVCCCLIVALIFSAVALAQTREEPPLITVTGTAEVNVVPDLAELSFGVETRDKDLALARGRNNTAVASVLAVIKKFGIEARDVQTSEVQIAPSFDNENDGRRVQYFSVNSGFRVVLRKIGQAADFVSQVLGAGANQVASVRFSSSESRKYADRARVLALQSAKEKALAVAKELGVQLGKPYRAIEGGENWGTNPRANSSAFVEQFWLRSEGIEPGQVKIAAIFTVSFQMQ